MVYLLMMMESWYCRKLEELHCEIGDVFDFIKIEISSVIADCREQNPLLGKVRY